MASASLSSGWFLTLLVAVAACTPAQANTGLSSTGSIASDTVEARQLFEQNIEAIHKRDRARYLATYRHTQALARNGPAGLELGYEGWSATSRLHVARHACCAESSCALGRAGGRLRDLLLHRNPERHDIKRRLGERVFVKTPDGWKIAVTTAFGLPAGAPAQCK